MSDIPAELPIELPPPPGEPTPDTEFLALLDKLGPVLAEVAKSAVSEAVATTPTPTFRPGAVQGVSAADRTASVLVDGDTAAITAQVLTDLPSVNDRVMLCFAPPAAVFVTGLITQSGTPAGVIAPYAGPITHHAGSESGSTTGAPPRGWLWCAGQAVSRADYPALFAAIGTTYGAGNGTTTFNVPDLRGRLPIGLDNMGGSDAGRIGLSNTLGTAGGTSTITTSHLPAHTHDLGSHTHSFTPSGSVSISSVSGTVSGTTGTQSADHTHNSPNGASFATDGGGPYLLGGGGTFNINTSAGATTSGNSGSHTHSFSGSLSGGSGSGSFSGNGGTTGAAFGSTGSAGSGSEFLPPVMAVHWIVKA